MKWPAKIIIILIILPIIAVGLMLLDFTINRNSYDEEIFYKEIYFDDFLRTYLRFGRQFNDNEDCLFIDECEHSISIEGEKYKNQKAINYDEMIRWEEEEFFWFKKEEPYFHRIDLFRISTSDFFSHSDTIFFEVSNFTTHNYNLTVEEYKNCSWSTTDDEIQLIDSIYEQVNTHCDSLYYKYINQNQLNYEGIIRKYQIKPRKLNNNIYRIKAYLNKHQPITSNFEFIDSLPIKWTINDDSDIKLDSFEVKIKNKSGSSLFYLDRSSLLIQRLKYDLRIFRKDSIEHIPHSGFGCGTGIYLHCLKNNQEIKTKLPIEIRELRINKTDNIPKLIDEYYGDSIGVRLSLLAIVPVWSKYKHQDIYSKEFIIRTKDILANKKRKNKRVNK